MLSKKNLVSQNTSTLFGFTPVMATGGVEQIKIINGTRYKLHIFTNIGSDSLIIHDPGTDKKLEYLVVAGGGGGGMDMGGGGGGGGVLYGSYPLYGRETISITVGAGGQGGPAGSGGYRTDGTGPQPSVHQFTVGATSGGNSTFGTITTIGGGYGGSSYYQYTPNNGNPGSGGCGGGPSGYSDGGTRTGGSGTSGQGFSGGNAGGQYYSGGGGGAGGPGVSSTAQPHGGPGIFCDILGLDLYWGGGGGGAAYSAGSGGNGGIGGGGGGAVGSNIGGAGYNPGYSGYGGTNNAQTNTKGGDAGPNTGGGGGGGSHYNATNKGGEGGSGIVVVRYPLEVPLTPISLYSSKLILSLDPGDLASYPGSGTTLYDISGNGNHVQLYNSPTWSAANGSFTFNGTNQWARTINNLNLSGYDQITVEAFIRVVNANVGMAYEHTADWNTNSGGWGLYTYSAGGAYVLNSYHTNHNGGSGAVNYNATLGSTWAHHVHTYSKMFDSYGRTIYVNGSAVAPASGSNYVSSGALANAPLFFAARGGTSAWSNLELGEFRIYARKLRPTEVSERYNYSKARYPGML